MFWYNIIFVVICVVVVAVLGFIYSQLENDLPEEWNEDDIP